MASSLRLYRATKVVKTLRPFSSKSWSHHNEHDQNHEYLDPTPFVGSWEPPRDPYFAHKKLHQLRRNYKDQMKTLRKKFAAEVEQARLEKLRRQEAHREAMRIDSEERTRLKAEARQARDLQYKDVQQDLRLALAKEREEKFEYWKKREQQMQEKKKEKFELTRKKSSEWIEPFELEERVRIAIAS